MLVAVEARHATGEFVIIEGDREVLVESDEKAAVDFYRQARAGGREVRLFMVTRRGRMLEWSRKTGEGFVSAGWTVIFRPGAPPTKSADNVFSTWAELVQTINEDVRTTSGIDIVIDDSLAQATICEEDGVLDGTHRPVTIMASTKEFARERGLPLASRTTEKRVKPTMLALAPNAQLKNLGGIAGNVQITSTSDRRVARRTRQGARAPHMTKKKRQKSFRGT